MTMTNGYFIDWLTIEQTHNVVLPVVSEKEAIYIETSTGEAVGSRVYGLKLTGSYSTVLSVSCDGSTVRVDGNPSRFGRPDNLFGISSFEGAVAVYNRVLYFLGLPPFTHTTSVDYLTGSDGSRVRSVPNGAVIRRVDWTKNFFVGSGNETDFLAALSTQTIARKVPHLFPNGQTLTFHDAASFGRSQNGSRHIYHKVYCKAFDMRIFERSKKYASLSVSDKQYFQRLIRFSEGKGIIREEKEFKGKWLDKNKLSYYGLIKETDFLPYLNEVETAMNRLSINAEFSDVAAVLLERGICKSSQAANSTERAFQCWIHGHPLKRTSQWYLHRKRLQALGFDIGVKLDLTKKLPTIKSGREITVSPASPPSWYKMPGPHLSLVA